MIVLKFSITTGPHLEPKLKVIKCTQYIAESERAIHSQTRPSVSSYNDSEQPSPVEQDSIHERRNTQHGERPHRKFDDKVRRVSQSIEKEILSETHA